jgi:hypothetical protein
MVISLARLWLWSWVKKWGEVRGSKPTFSLTFAKADSPFTFDFIPSFCDRRSFL